MRSRVSIILVVALCSPLTRSAFSAIPPACAPPAPAVEDPTIWTPPAQLPTFEPALNDQDLKAHIDKLLPTYIPALPEAPWYGMVIKTVEPDSQASRLELKPGDILISIDGTPVHISEELRRARKTNADNQLARVWDKTHQRYRLVTFLPGEVGFTCDPAMNPARLYIHNLPKGQSPDQDVIAACLAVANAVPDLPCAKTLLSRLLAKQDPPGIVYYLAARTAVVEARYDDVLAFAKAAEDHLPQDQHWILYWPKHGAAILAFRLEVAAEEENTFEAFAPLASDHQYKAVANALSDFRKMPMEKMSNPVEEFAHLDAKDRTSEIQVAGDDPVLRKVENEIHTHRWHHVVDTSRDPDMAIVTAMTQPRAANIDYSAVAQFKPAMDDPGAKRPCVRFLIMQNENEAMFCMHLFPDGNGSFSGANELPELRTPMSPVMNNHRFKVRVTTVGNRVEALINNRRVYYGFVRTPESTRQLFIEMKAVACDESVTDIALRTADARKNAAAATQP